MYFRILVSQNIKIKYNFRLSQQKDYIKIKWCNSLFLFCIMLIWPDVHFCIQFHVLHFKNTDKLESIQRITTKMIRGTEGKTFKGRLEAMNIAWSRKDCRKTWRLREPEMLICKDGAERFRVDPENKNQ